MTSHRVMRFFFVMVVLSHASMLRAELFRADYTINFFPPNPCAEGTLRGSLSFFYQFERAGDLLLPDPGPPEISSLVFGQSRSGSLLWDLDVRGGTPTFFVSFEGGLLCPSHGPPEMPVFAFEAGAAPTEAPAGAPLIPLGDPFLPNPGPPDLPLFAFGSVYEVGSLSVSVHQVPLPSAALLLLTGFGTVGRFRKRLL